jgi:hypothetical protein
MWFELQCRSNQIQNRHTNTTSCSIPTRQDGINHSFPWNELRLGRPRTVPFSFPFTFHRTNVNDSLVTFILHCTFACCTHILFRIYPFSWNEKMKSSDTQKFSSSSLHSKTKSGWKSSLLRGGLARTCPGKIPVLARVQNLLFFFSFPGFDWIGKRRGGNDSWGCVEMLAGSF